MAIQDIRLSTENQSFQADLCIIGSGPAGLSIALQFAHSSIKVLVLESGGFDRESEIEAFNEIESVGIRRAGQDVTRCRGLGGSSAVWSGRCAVLDSTDFQHRPWIRDSGWPIDYSDVAPFVDRASQMLGLGPSLYSRDRWGAFGRGTNEAPWDASKLAPVFFQASQHDAADQAVARYFAATGTDKAEHIGALQHAGVPKARDFGTYYRPILQACDNITVLLHANVTEIETNEAGDAATSVRIKTLAGQSFRASASHIVLACGGIDNARLLLASRSRNPSGVGNQRDAVGRYLMDHPFAQLSSYAGEGSLELRRRLTAFWFDRSGIRHVFHPGLRLHPELQRRNGLLNCAIHMVEFGDEPAPIARVANALRLAKNRNFGGSFWRELGAASANPQGIMSGAYDRFVHRRPSLSRPTSVVFGAVVEQLPDRDSRVTLSKDVDALGLPRARIDWRASDLEYETARFFSGVLNQEFARLGYKLPTPSAWLEGGADAYRAGIHDMAHPIGATRMSTDPTRGVVDENCAVHGVSNLFIAGSSTFPTSGYVNPTLTIVSLSLRLADHLKVRLSESVIATHQFKSVLPFRRKTRVGIVGAGDRIQRIYVPILSALAEFEVAGVTSRTTTSASRVAETFGAPTYATAEDLVRDAQPDFLLVAVPDSQIETILAGLTGLKVPLLVETPIAWKVRSGRTFLKGIREHGLVVGVAEQTPFLPAELLKQKVIDLGLIGRVTSAHNDLTLYAYHGVAALKGYVAADNYPVRVAATRPLHDATSAGRVEGVVTCRDGAELRHRSSDLSSGAGAGVKVRGSSGTIADDVISFDSGDGAGMRSTIVRHTGERGELVALTVDTPMGEIKWRNPYGSHVLSDEQYAVAHLLAGMAGAVQYGGWPAYEAAQAVEDMDILAAIRYSQQLGGKSITLPTNQTTLPITGKIASKLRRKH